MCYSAQIEADYRNYLRLFRASISIHEFVDLFYQRERNKAIRIPRAMEAPFVAAAQSAEELEIRSLIEQHRSEEAMRLEEELFKQRRRLADAERSLAAKSTKGALESRRIASEKVVGLRAKLDDLRRPELEDRDSRIFPGNYAPVMVMEEGRLVVKPMRYHCRPASAPASYDTQYPGTYNARRDNLEGRFWGKLFGHAHGIIIVRRFYENVKRHRLEGRELQSGEKPENVVLRFDPRPSQDMLVACLWSRWSGESEDDLLSFAAITDEPPPEVAAAGHDRCIVPLKPEHVEAWLNPRPNDRSALYAILDDRPRPYYEHRIAA